MDRAWQALWSTAVVVVAALGLGPTPVVGGQEATPTMAVDPATHLVDAQEISVTATGLPAQSAIRLTQCPTTATDVEACETRSPSFWTETGELTETLRLRTVIRDSGSVETDCRAVNACDLVAFAYDDGTPQLVEVVRTALHFHPDGPLLPAPTMAVTPSDGLVDGQTVAVAGSGFVRDPYVSVVQCTAGPISWETCDISNESFAEVSDGAFETEVRVFAVIFPGEGAVPVDCRTTPCVLVGTSGDLDDRDAASAPSAFDPDAPLLPPPSLTVTPNAELRDGQVVQVDGAGFHRSPYVQFALCAPDPAPERCRMRFDDWRPVGDDGTISTQYSVTARIRTPEGVVDCRTSVEPCVLVLGDPVLDPNRSARAALLFDPDAPLLPDPTITAAPVADLGDFSSVTVHGTNFTPGERARVEVCTAGEPRLCDGDNGEEPTAAADGTLSTEVAVFANFGAENGGPTTVDCRVSPGCVLSVEDEVRGLTAETPLAFGPPDPARERYRDPVFSEVEVTRDVVYRHTTDYRGDAVDLAVDIYRPAGDTATARPAVIWMYGGWFKFGDKTDGYVQDYAAAWAKRGYVSVALNYRVRPDLDIGDLGQVALAMWDAYDDAVAGGEWLRENAAEYGIDPDAISATGWSAGGVTSLNLAYLPGDRGPAESPIAAAMPIAALLATDIDAGEPPSIVFRATDDNTLPPGFNNSDTVCPKAAAVGIPCEYVAYDGAGHGIVSRHADIVRRSTDFVSEVVLDPLGYFDVTADAGGPYQVDEGSSVGLDGSGSAGDGLSYAWSPGERVDEPTAVSPRLVGLDDATETLGLAVTNAHGISATDSAQVTTRNVAPTITSAAVSANPGGPTKALDAAIADPGRADTHTATVDWGDGVVESVPVEQSAGSAVVRAGHDYAVGGTYTVALIVTDDDGGAAEWTGSALVGCTVTGTEGRDVLIGTSGDDVICGLGANDVVLGLGGNDTILGGPGHDLLLGGLGDDVVDGEAGWDIVLGGPGTDTCTTEVRISCAPPR